MGGDEGGEEDRWIGEQEENDVSILIPLAPSLQLSQADCAIYVKKSMNRPINSFLLL